MKLEFESLTIASAQEIHEHFLSYLLSDQLSLELDLANVNKIDLCAIQLLLSLQKSCQEQNKQLTIINPTNSVTAAFALCGADRLLGYMDE